MSKIIILGFYLFFYSKYLLAMDFLECIQDVPINNKIIEIKESCFVFDSDTGKIMSVEADSLSSNMEVLNFYKTFLIQFGWDLKTEKNNQAMVFIRDNEILKININNTNTIIFNSFLSFKNNEE
tara:strand:+ start:403 stop:774 length:372 start_codon:yes stop_codon:yes gene_type:complete